MNDGNDGLYKEGYSEGVNDALLVVENLLQTKKQEAYDAHTDGDEAALKKSMAAIGDLKYAVDLIRALDLP